MSPVAKKSKSLKKIPKVVKPDTTTFSVKKKVGKSCKVEVPNEMIDELKKERDENLETVLDSQQVVLIMTHVSLQRLPLTPKQ